VDRARAIFIHGSNLADPKRDPGYWKKWQDFEVSACGELMTSDIWDGLLFKGRSFLRRELLIHRTRSSPACLWMLFVVVVIGAERACAVGVVWLCEQVTHGNEDTFRDMLRVKRTVQTAFSQVTADVK
jgi:hypothetical protein